MLIKVHRPVISQHWTVCWMFPIHSVLVETFNWVHNSHSMKTMDIFTDSMAIPLTVVKRFQSFMYSLKKIIFYFLLTLPTRSPLSSQIQYGTPVGECWCTVKQASPALPPSAWPTWWSESGYVWMKRSSLYGGAAASSPPTSASWANCCSSSRSSSPPRAPPKPPPRQARCSDPRPRQPPPQRQPRPPRRSFSTSQFLLWTLLTCTTAPSRPPPAADRQTIQAFPQYKASTDWGCRW